MKNRKGKEEGGLSADCQQRVDNRQQRQTTALVGQSSVCSLVSAALRQPLRMLVLLLG